MSRQLRVAAIDCGTNSIRLLITDVVGDHKTDLLRKMRVVRLGQGVDESGRLADEAISRTIEACREYAESIADFGPDIVRFGATSAVRDSKNSSEFGDAVEAILGVRPEVLTGEQEAQASFDGATRGLGDDHTAVIDIGGGSTEIVLGDRSGPSWSKSLDIGSVRLTERFLHSDPPQTAEVHECTRFLDELIAPTVAGLIPARVIVGVAGTFTTVAAHALAISSYDPSVIHRARILRDDVRQAAFSLLGMSVAERRALPYMHPGRADVIGAGALILDRVLEHLPAATGEVLVSEQDILDGIAWAAASTWSP